MTRDEMAVIAEAEKAERIFRDMVELQEEMDRVQLEDYDSYEDFLNRD